MKLGFKKDKAAAAAPGNLFGQCEELFAASRRLVREDRHGCADLVLDLVSPGGEGTYLLSFRAGPYPHLYYGMFPPEGIAGHGSFMNPDGSFKQYGHITRDEAARVLATFTPARRPGA